MRYPSRIQHVKSCKFCTDYKGDPKPIPPEELQYAIKMPSGDYKCKTCVDLYHRDMIVHVTPNSHRAKEIVAEEQREVNHHNDYAKRLNKSAGYNLMKLKKVKYL